MIPLSKLEVHPKTRVASGVCHQCMPLVPLPEVEGTPFEWESKFARLSHLDYEISRSIIDKLYWEWHP